ncbi:MAG: hypothetical protein HOO96_10325 [Polyangiaceae bacterium]|nr:hypothetical protein [Polyangiaceae bacterium]
MHRTHFRRPRGASLLSLALVASASIVACGGSGSATASGGARVSGQSALMEQTFAGKCNPKSAERPFIIEWDATDASGFQARANTGLVFVKYEGCDLKVLDACGPEDKTAYKDPEWTAGSIEKVDINTEGELYAKLPLGAASLGARASAGEKFHMEYFVSGTRNATKVSYSKAELAKLPGCKGATHFVYGYNLGAFALGSLTNAKGEAGVSFKGIGAGGSQSSSTNAEKKGGLLGTCSPDKPETVKTCQSPIRLSVRELE